MENFKKSFKQYLAVTSIFVELAEIFNKDEIIPAIINAIVEIANKEKTCPIEILEQMRIVLIDTECKDCEKDNCCISTEE